MLWFGGFGVGKLKPFVVVVVVSREFYVGDHDKSLSRLSRLKPSTLREHIGSSCMFNPGRVFVLFFFLQYSVTVELLVLLLSALCVTYSFLFMFGQALMLYAYCGLCSWGCIICLGSCLRLYPWHPFLGIYAWPTDVCSPSMCMSCWIVSLVIHRHQPLGFQHDKNSCGICYLCVDPFSVLFSSYILFCAVGLINTLLFCNHIVQHGKDKEENGRGMALPPLHARCLLSSQLVVISRLQKYRDFTLTLRDFFY